MKINPPFEFIPEPDERLTVVDRGHGNAVLEVGVFSNIRLNRTTGTDLWRRLDEIYGPAGTAHTTT